MSMARHRAKGDKPEEVYIVSENGRHRLYSTHSAAKGVRTSTINYTYSAERQKEREQSIRIFKGVITEWVDVTDD